MTTKRPEAVQAMLDAAIKPPDRPGEFAPRPLRAGETFDLLRALEQKKHAVELWEGFELVEEREKLGSPINAIESIIAADHATLFPLPAALEWLVTCLQRWHRAKGSLTMDQAMGLSPKYRGAGGTAATRNTRSKRDQTTAAHMASLTALGFSARAASVLTARAMTATERTKYLRLFGGPPLPKQKRGVKGSI